MLLTFAFAQGNLFKCVPCSAPHFPTRPAELIVRSCRTPAEWNFETTPQKYAAGRKLYQPRGKMLGGCSAIKCAALVSIAAQS